MGNLEKEKEKSTSSYLQLQMRKHLQLSVELLEFSHFGNKNVLMGEALLHVGEGSVSADWLSNSASRIINVRGRK